MDVIALHDGRIMQVHDEELCEDEYCCVHNPSNHPLRRAPLRWITLLRIMVRVCPHGYWHPDPDDLKIRELTTFSALLRLGHDCDGCCRVGPDVITEDLRRRRRDAEDEGL